MKTFNKGDKVKWDWGNGSATGEVVKEYTQKRTLKIDGNEVTRDASEDEPSYKIKQDDGQTVFKSVTELDAA